MAIKRGDIELAGLTKSYDGVHTVVAGHQPENSGWRLLLFSRAFRVRQDHDPAHDRGP